MSLWWCYTSSFWDLTTGTNVCQPHSELTLTLHPPGWGGNSEGGRSGMEKRCCGIFLSASSSSLSSLVFKSPLLPRAACFLSLFKSHSSMLRPEISLSSESSLCCLSFSMCLFKLNSSSSDMWENLQFGPKSQIPFWRNFRHGFFICSSCRIAAESLNWSNQAFLALWCWTPFRCFFLLCMLSWKDLSQ